jgi:predicted RNase H-like nuclease (RuvC/YqgF family)
MAAAARCWSGGRRRARELYPHPRRQREATGRIEALETRLERATRVIDELSAQFEHLQRTVTTLTTSRMTATQMPFTERAQALRMVREGRPARQIAAALGLPQGEILLLTRVHEMQLGEAPRGASQPAPPRPDPAAQSVERLLAGMESAR